MASVRILRAAPGDLQVDVGEGACGVAFERAECRGGDGDRPLLPARRARALGDADPLQEDVARLDAVAVGEGRRQIAVAPEEQLHDAVVAEGTGQVFLLGGGDVRREVVEGLAVLAHDDGGPEVARDAEWQRDTPELALDLLLARLRFEREAARVERPAVAEEPDLGAVVEEEGVQLRGLVAVGAADERPKPEEHGAVLLLVAVLADDARAVLQADPHEPLEASAEAEGRDDRQAEATAAATGRGAAARRRDGLRLLGDEREDPALLVGVADVVLGRPERVEGEEDVERGRRVQASRGRERLLAARRDPGGLHPRGLADVLDVEAVGLARALRERQQILPVDGLVAVRLLAARSRQIDERRQDGVLLVRSHRREHEVGERGCRGEEARKRNPTHVGVGRPSADGEDGVGEQNRSALKPASRSQSSCWSRCSTTCQTWRQECCKSAIHAWRLGRWSTNRECGPWVTAAVVRDCWSRASPVHIVVMKFSDDDEVALLVWLGSRPADDYGMSLTLVSRERRTARIMAAAKRRGYRGRSVDAASTFLTKMLLPRKVLLPTPT